MQLKLMPLLAPVIALAVTTAPLAVKAETQVTAPVIVAQEPDPVKGPYERLGLTDQQKNQIGEIRQKSRSQIEAILTQEQKEKFKTAMQNRQGMRGAIKAMNLTPEQNKQIRQIMQSSREQINAVLTAEQKQQLQELRENKPSQRQQGNP